MIKAVFWDFGGVITSSPFESFNRFEKENELPLDFLRLVNSTNPNSNAWAKLERNEINLDEFDELFQRESRELGHSVKGKDVIIKGGMSTKIGGTKVLIKAGATCDIKGGAKVSVKGAITSVG